MTSLLSEHVLAIANTPEFLQFAKDQVLAVEVRGAEDLAPEIPREVERWSNTARLAHEN